jgi:hypothetical protein
MIVVSQAEVGGAERRDVAARTAPEHEHIRLFRQFANYHGRFLSSALRGTRVSMRVATPRPRAADQPRLIMRSGFSSDCMISFVKRAASAPSTMR